MDLEYEKMLLKIPIESDTYLQDSQYIISQMERIIQHKIDVGENKIILNTNLKLGLPIENINKIAGPILEAWAFETFSTINKDIHNEYKLINVEAGSRLSVADVILQFNRDSSITTGYVDVKATSEDIKNSGKAPNITSFARIRTEYIKNPDFIFIILSLKNKTYSTRNIDSKLMDGIMEVTKYNVYDLKYISDRDISYNPALGTGQIQIKDIHYVDMEYRTTFELVQLLDYKYLKSSKRDINQWYNLAQKYEWIK